MCEVDFADIMATGRRSNSADAKDLAKIIRGNLAQLVPMSSLSLEEMARDHGDLLKDILKATSRPNSGLLKDALTQSVSVFAQGRSRCMLQQACFNNTGFVWQVEVDAYR